MQVDYQKGAAGSMERICLDRAGSGFIKRDSKREFLARGFNYDHDHAIRFMEDYWDAEWEKVERDFAEMKRMRANTVRVHPQLGLFMESPERARPHMLDQLARLVELAERTGLYLDITGAGCYRRKDVPEWLVQADEAVRWETQANFWGAVA